MMNEANLKLGLVQMNGSNQVTENILFVTEQLAKASQLGVQLVQLPEMANMVERNKAGLHQQLCFEHDCPFLQAMQKAAKQYGFYIHIGSCAFKNDHLSNLKENSLLSPAPPAINRAILINPQGEIIARYDKIHMFDVNLPSGESYQESLTYHAGSKLSIAETTFGNYGLSICYDLRFAGLYRKLSQMGARILSAPACFTATTGRAHWEVLLRARAIENSTFIIAAAQTGKHKDGRVTYGHSMVVNPWGEVILDAGDQAGLFTCELNLQEIERVRSMIPAWNISDKY